MFLQLYLLITLPLYHYLFGITAFTKFHIINTIIAIITKNIDLIYICLCSSFAINFSIHTHWGFDNKSFQECKKWAPNILLFHIGHFVLHILPLLVLIYINKLQTRSNRTLTLVYTSILYHLLWAIYINKSFSLNKVYQVNSDNTFWFISWSMALVGHIIYYTLSSCEN